MPTALIIFAVGLIGYGIWTQIVLPFTARKTDKPLTWLARRLAASKKK